MKLSEIPEASSEAPAARMKLSQVKEEPSLWQELTTSTPGDGERTPRLHSLWEGLKQGIKDVGQGGAQIGARMMAAGPEEGAGAFDDPAARAAMPGRVDSAMQQSRQAYEQNPLVQAHPDYAAGGRIGGNMAATAPLAMLPGGGPTLAGRAGMGAVAGGLGAVAQPVESDDYWTAKGKQLAAGMATGGAIGGALGRMAGSPAAQDLRAQGVPLTPGMQLGARGFERTLESFPILRGMIQRGEARSIDGFNKAAANQALEPLGETVPRNMVAGHGLIDYLKDRLGAAFDKTLPYISFAETEWQNLMSSPRLQQRVSEMSDDHASRLAKILNNRVSSRFQSGMLDGQQFKLAESELSDRAAAWGRGSQDRDLGDVLREVVAEMRGSLVQQNPQYAKELQNINSSYAMFTRLRRASLGATEGGKFTPSDLLQSSLAMDKTAGKGAFAAGDALMEAFAEAANKTLGKVTDPGSTVPSRGLRSLTELLAIGSGGGFLHGGPAGAGAGAALAGAAPYVAGAGMKAGAALGRAPESVQQGIAGAAGAGAARAIPQDRTRQRLKAAAKVGELQNERYQANRRGDLAAVQDLGQKLAEAHRAYRDLGGTA